jgi:acetyltransferase
VLLKRILSPLINTLLKGYRNIEGVDEIDLFRTVYKVGLLIQYFDHIKEIDINPLIMNKQTLHAVDARIILNNQ